MINISLLDNVKSVCKVAFLGVILLVFVTEVNAYTTVKSFEFEKYMEEHGYVYEVNESGTYAYKESESGLLLDNYTYLSFDSDEDAINYIKDSYQETISYSNTVRVNDNYNILESNKDSSSYFSMDWTIPNSNVHFYCYYFRYKNIVVYGNSDFKDKDTVISVVQDLFKDKEPVKSQNIASDKGKKLSIFGFVKNNFHFVVIGCIAMTVIWVCITVILFMTDKKGK